MLVEFSVTNYRSFGEKMTLSMVASSDRHLPENVIEVTEPTKMRLLRSAAIYGPNASGKTNLLRAMGELERLVRKSATEHKPDDPVGVVPFRLDPARVGRPTELEAVFLAEGQRWTYGVALDDERVHEEWLTVAGRGKPRLLFHRHEDGSVEWGNSWRGERERLREATRGNVLLLSQAAQFNSHSCAPAHAWFVRLWAPQSTPLGSLSAAWTAERPEFRAWVVALLAAADSGITGVEVVTRRVEDSELWTWAGESFRRWLREVYPDGRREVVTTHRDTAGNDVRFRLDDDESAGTRQLYATAFLWYLATTRGHPLVVDELESSLHPLITRALIGMVHSAPTNPQLIFTTHDCGLLDAELLRRDQVWFTEKTPDGATDLYSLWDYKLGPPRNDENYRKGYLSGRYGAIPFVGEFSFGKDTGVE